MARDRIKAASAPLEGHVLRSCTFADRDCTIGDCYYRTVGPKTPMEPEKIAAKKKDVQPEVAKHCTFEGAAHIARARCLLDLRPMNEQEWDAIIKANREGTTSPLPLELARETDVDGEYRSPSSPEGMTAQRHNKDKLMLDAIPYEWLAALAAVMNSGQDEGYPYRNWEEGGAYSTPVGCMRRHEGRWHMKETYDKDGTHHMAKVAWNALQLMTWEIRGVGRDDLNRQTRDVVSKVTAPGKDYE